MRDAFFSVLLVVKGTKRVIHTPSSFTNAIIQPSRSFLCGHGYQVLANMQFFSYFEFLQCLFKLLALITAIKLNIGEAM